MGRKNVLIDKKPPGQIDLTKKGKALFGQKACSLLRSVFCDVHAAAKNGLQLICRLRAANSARLF
jgi:hypothetical protein